MKTSQDWKSGAPTFGLSVAPYNPTLEEPADTVSVPDLLLCEMGTDGNTGAKTLVLSSTTRAKWQDDPIRKNGWAEEIAKFDARCLTNTTFVLWKTSILFQVVPTPETKINPKS